MKTALVLFKQVPGFDLYCMSAMVELLKLMSGESIHHISEPANANTTSRMVLVRSFYFFHKHETLNDVYDLYFN